MNNYFSSSRTISILLAISIGWSAPAFSNDVKWEQHHESEVAGFALRFGWQSVITNDSSLDTPDKVLRFHRNKLREYMAAQEQGDQYRNLILLSFLTAAHNYKNLPENKRLYSMAKEKYVTKYGAVNDKLIRAAAENMIPRSVDSVVSFLNNQPKYIQENEYAVKAEYKAWLNLVASRMMISEKFPELKEASEVQNLNQLIASSRKKINDLLEKEKVLNGRVNTTDSVLDLLGYLTLIVSAITTVLLVLAPAAGIPLSAGLTALGIVAIPLGGVTIANSVHKERYIELQTMRSKIVKLVDLELSTRKKIVNILLTNDKLRAEIDNLSLNSQDEQPLNLDHLK